MKISPIVQIVSRVFDGMQDRETANQCAARVNAKRGSVVASLVDHQAQLSSTNDLPVELCNETPHNSGPAVACQITGTIMQNAVK
jgi:hypothetical protein